MNAKQHRQLKAALSAIVPSTVTHLRIEQDAMVEPAKVLVISGKKELGQVTDPSGDAGMTLLTHVWMRLREQKFGFEKEHEDRRGSSYWVDFKKR
jgi:hypothetical protein